MNVGFLECVDALWGPVAAWPAYPVLARQRYEDDNTGEQIPFSPALTS